MSIYVQYGCGLSCPDGWINFDASPTLRLQRLPLIGSFLRRGSTIFPANVRYGDIIKGLPITNNSAHGVYASHILEHLSYTDFWHALANTYRILRPGGLFRLVVPDLEARARKYLSEISTGDAEANSRFMRASSIGAETRLRGVRMMAQAAFGNTHHLWMWDEPSMAAALRSTGFTNVRRCKFNDSSDKMFQLVEDHTRFRDESYGIDECAMEALKSS